MAKLQSKEGSEMWKNINSQRRSNSPIPTSVASVPLSPNQAWSLSEIENIFLRKEIARMIKNSELVILDCDLILSALKTKEEYQKSDTKVAKYIHTNIKDRLQRVLDGFPAFDYEIKLDDED